MAALKLHRLLVTLAVLTWIVVTGTPVDADTPFLTLLPGERADYRFDYNGDGSQIRIKLDASDLASVVLSIYTPEQTQTRSRGESVNPIGRGTLGRDQSLSWAGGFRIPGVFHAIVENRALGPVLYRLNISGDAVSGAAPVALPVPLAKSALVHEGGTRLLSVPMPPGAGANPRLAMPPLPLTCTHAQSIPATITQSTRLCANEIYPPLKIVGEGIGLYSDDARSAIVTSAGRQFAITVEGNGNWVEGVIIQARTDSRDVGAWLCLYDECVFPTKPTPTTLQGGIRYGGGILLRGTGTTIHSVTVKGGTIGIAMVGGRDNYIVDNELSDLNGWGSFNVGAVNSYFVGNVLNRENRGCTTPDGRKFLHGCETSGWVCLGCQSNVVASNHCEKSANCFYMSGERGLASNDNRLIANFCAGATDNCFEITFSQRNWLQDNVATVEVRTDAPCKYPFWIGGSVVYFKGNTWQCSISADDAFDQARDSTVIATNIINVTASTPLPAIRGQEIPIHEPAFFLNGDCVSWNSDGTCGNR